MTQKRIKFTVKEEKDKISSLLDCLLIEIISRLPDINEALRTCVLSKRWQHLWPYVPNLVFNNYKNDSLSDFFSFIEKALTQCRHLSLNKFKLDTKYDSQFESQVNNCIRYAVNCNVQDLHLLLKTPGFEGGFLLDSEYFFINSCFTKLKLVDCQFNPSGTISWKNLRSLSITYVELNEGLIQNILSGSPILETFKLMGCYGFSRMDITSKSLKNLVLSGYLNLNRDTHIIQVNAPNIWSLTIQCCFWLWKLLLVDVSCLVKAHLDYTKYGHYVTTHEDSEEDMLKALILSLRHVKELTIGDSCQTVLSRLEAKGFTIPSKLRS